jgi:hypothetical protein
VETKHPVSISVGYFFLVLLSSQNRLNRFHTIILNIGNNHPDTKLFPYTTGAAAQMVKVHEKEESLKLYFGWVYTQTPLIPGN